MGLSTDSAFIVSISSFSLNFFRMYFHAYNIKLLLSASAFMHGLAIFLHGRVSIVAGANTSIALYRNTAVDPLASHIEIFGTIMRFVRVFFMVVSTKVVC
jgi:hypothetical protein